jgi:transaldolase
LAAAGKSGYARLIDNAIIYAKEKGGSIDVQVENAMDRLVSELVLSRSAHK